MDVRGFFQRWGTYLLIGGIVFAVAYLFIGRRNAHVSQNVPGGALLPGAQSQPGANGQPVVEFVPTTGDTYENINYQTNSGNTTGPVTTTTNISNAPPVVGGSSTVPPPPTLPPTGPKPPPPGPPSPLPPQPVYKPYEIKHGDTLGSIAAAHHTTWQSLYQLNKGTIDAWAARFHFPIAGGPWNNIFPTEKLQVPA